MHESSVPIAPAQMPLKNDSADVFSKARVLNFNLKLHQHPFFVFVISECSGLSGTFHNLVDTINILTGSREFSIVSRLLYLEIR